MKPLIKTLAIPLLFLAVYGIFLLDLPMFKSWKPYEFSEQEWEYRCKEIEQRQTKYCSTSGMSATPGTSFTLLGLELAASYAYSVHKSNKCKDEKIRLEWVCYEHEFTKRESILPEETGTKIYSIEKWTATCAEGSNPCKKMIVKEKKKS